MLLDAVATLTYKYSFIRLVSLLPIKLLKTYDQ